jgi:hypothetical protein
VKGGIEHKESDKHVPSFNIEHELSKIKIHVPLIELAKNPFIISRLRRSCMGWGPQINQIL